MRNLFAAVAIAALAATTVPANAVSWVSPWVNANCSAGTAGYTATADGWNNDGTVHYVTPNATIGDGSSAGYIGNGIQLFANYGGTVTDTSTAFTLAAPSTSVGGWYRYYSGLRAGPTANIQVMKETAPAVWTTVHTVTVTSAPELAWQSWYTSLGAGNYKTMWTWYKPKPDSYPTPPEYLAPNQGWLQFDGGVYDDAKTPEPASMVMLGMAATGFLAARRRRKAAKKA